MTKNYILVLNRTNVECLLKTVGVFLLGVEYRLIR